MEQWQRNQEVVSKGGGSPQARADHSDCLMCNPPEEVEEGEDDDRETEKSS